MFDFDRDDRPKAKCFFAHYSLPKQDAAGKKTQVGKTDAERVLKGAGGGNTSNSRFAHTLDLLLPEEVFEILRQMLEDERFTTPWSRVHMRLGELLEKDFFHAFVKSGTASMLSEGRPGIDNCFELHDGTLRLDIDRATYERCGLPGQPIQGPGRKHTRTRYLVELNLRLPSMLHGKRGFERIRWAFREVLNSSVTWLFHSPSPDTAAESPMAKHFPLAKTTVPELSTLADVTIPALSSITPGTFGNLPRTADTATDVLEYLHLLSLDAPTLHANHVQNPQICRYEPPDLSEPATPSTTGTVVRVRWKGFLQQAFLTRVLDMALKGAGGGGWVAVSVKWLNGDGVTWLMRDGEVVEWRYRG